MVAKFKIINVKCQSLVEGTDSFTKFGETALVAEKKKNLIPFSRDDFSLTYFWLSIHF